MMLQTIDLTLTVRKGARLRYILWRVSLDVRRGERVAVVGESGGGKSSLAWTMMGHALPGQKRASGRVLYRGSDLCAMTPRELAAIRFHRIAMVPQNAQCCFHPARTLVQSAEELYAKAVISGHPRGRGTLDERLGRASRPLGISNALWLRYPHQLSGGQKQRMALCLALLNEPEVLILDEPTNALDGPARDSMLEYLNAYMRERPASGVLFTHDIGLAVRWASRIIVLYRGQIVEECPSECVEDALHPYTRGLLGARVVMGDAPLSRGGIAGSPGPVHEAPGSCCFAERCSVALEKCLREVPEMVTRNGGRVGCLRAGNEGLSGREPASPVMGSGRV